MLFWTIALTALKSLRSNKLRSFLTVLGVIIGVASVITMLALGAGTRAKVTESVRNNGANIFSVRPAYKPTAGGVRSGNYVSLKVPDAEAIVEQVPEVDMVSPDTDNDYVVKHMSRNTMVQVNGEAVPYFVMRNCLIATGRAFREEEVVRRSRVAVLGPKTVEKLFGADDPVGDSIKINGVNYLVIGTTKSKDDHSDDNIWVPYTTVMNQLMGVDSLHQIYCHVPNDVPMQTAIAKVSDVIRKRHHIQAGQIEDFSIRNNQEAADALDQVSTTLTALLAGIAGISLLVGGINIMNIMLVTVTERTREIGIRKALGARHWDLLGQFLMESTVISMTGGLAGIALGITTVLLFNDITERVSGQAFGAQLEILPAIVSFGFSALIGIFFGWYPARKAALLDPIDALRYE